MATAGIIGIAWFAVSIPVALAVGALFHRGEAEPRQAEVVNLAAVRQRPADRSHLRPSA